MLLHLLCRTFDLADWMLQREEILISAARAGRRFRRRLLQRQDAAGGAQIAEEMFGGRLREKIVDGDEVAAGGRAQNTFRQAAFRHPAERGGERGLRSEETQSE